MVATDLGVLCGESKLSACFTVDTSDKDTCYPSFKGNDGLYQTSAVVLSHHITISVVNVSDPRWCSGYTLRAYLSQRNCADKVIVPSYVATDDK